MRRAPSCKRPVRVEYAVRKTDRKRRKMKIVFMPLQSPKAIVVSPRCDASSFVERILWETIT